MLTSKFKKKKNLILIVIIILFLCIRFILLFTSPYIYSREECYVGAFAEDIINGLKRPLLDYQWVEAGDSAQDP